MGPGYPDAGALAEAMVWWWTVQLWAPPSEPAAIIGGDELTSPAGPVAALVDLDGNVVCTGTLLHPRWVLTAAHCFTYAQPVEVWWGTDLDQGPTETQPIASFVLDPEATPLRHDLALVELAQDAHAQPAVLVDAVPEVGDTLYAAGFGATDEMGGGAGVLRAVELEVLEVDEDLVHTWQGGANLCSGDSGAPLAAPGSSPLAVVAVASFLEPTCLGGGTAHTRLDTALDFVMEHVSVTVLPELPHPEEPEDTGVREEPESRDPNPESSEGRGCQTAPGPLGWAWLVLWGGAARGQLRQSHRRPRSE